MTAFLVRTLAEASIRAVVLAAAIAGVLAVVRVRSSAARHAVWTAVTGAMLTMPLLQHVAPPIPVALPHDSMAGTDLFDELTGSHTEMQVSGTAPRAVAAAERAPDSNGASRIADNSRDPRADILLVVYVGGVALLLLRRWSGWRRVSRLAAAASPIALPDDLSCVDSPAIRLRESAFIVTPVTVGILRPVVLLPTDRDEWPGGALRAVVAHEAAHVRRRDPLVTMIVQANGCLFWFHPLAWWLARAVASTAELATDADAIRATGDREQYAATLVAMARAVRANRGRLAWPGVGIYGSGLLTRRIERVLDGSLGATYSRRGTIAIAATCAMALLVAAGCRNESVRPAGADVVRERALRLMVREISSAPLADVMRQLSEPDARDITSLEEAVRGNHDDLDTLKQLLVAYWMEPPLAAAKRRDAILPLIERHPDSALAGSIEARIFPRRMDPSLDGDPDGYARAKASWLAHAARPGAPAAVLANASLFFEASEPLLAEQMLRRGESLHSDVAWSIRLGRLYAIVLTGSTTPRNGTHIRVLRAADPQGAYGTLVRAALRDTTDDVLLTSTGWFLARAPQGYSRADFDVFDWAATCLRRAIALNPRAIFAHTALLRVRSQQEFARQPLWQVAPAAQYQTISALPEPERFAQLARRARDARSAIEELPRWNDPNLRDRYALARDDARRYANDALRLAPRHRDDPQYGTAIYVANMTLGALALDDGRTREAVAFLRKASRAPESEQLRYADDIVTGLHWHFPADLLKRGERAAVADFAERMADMNLARRIELRDAAAAIRRGETPTMFR